MRTQLLWLLASILLLGSCKDPFEPPTTATNTSYLVVEGYINGNGPTTIKLSRTSALANALAQHPETNAQVTIEGSDNTSVELTPNGNGIYSVPSITLNTNAQYRVHIKTADSKEYVSDFVEYKTTPAITNLDWEKKFNGVQILLNTRDAENKTRYYRWEYEETWEFHSRYTSRFEWSASHKDVIYRTSNPDMYTCWQTAPSTRILLGSSARLQEDVISNYPVAFVPDTSWKLSVRYSILVKQFALTKKGFEYWQQLAKNTEQLGSIFDAQPAELTGNIRCLSNSGEVVIGYISAGTIEEKRIFIDHQEIPDFIHRRNCPMDTAWKDKDAVKDSLQSYFGLGLAIPIDAVMQDADSIGFTFSTKECVDCRTRGTNVKPSFW